MRTSGILAVLCLCWAATANAQTLAPRRDFFLGPPDGWIAVRSGWFFARAGSDWYDFITERFTIDAQRFNTGDVEVEAGVRVAPRIHALGGVGFTSVSLPSEYRDWVDDDRLPIVQTTRLRTLQVTGSVKLALVDRGRAVGQLVWIPRRVVPYVGAGGGALWYSAQQNGDFIDFVDLSVFPADFSSEGWSPTGHAFAGVDVEMLRWLRLTVDGRYRWVKTELNSDWVGFEPLDLSGFTLSAGVGFVF